MDIQQQLSYKTCPRCRPPQRAGGYWKCCQEHKRELQCEQQRESVAAYYAGFPEHVRKALRWANKVLQGDPASTRRQCMLGAVALVGGAFLTKRTSNQTEHYGWAWDQLQRLRQLAMCGDAPFASLQAESIDLRGIFTKDQSSDATLIRMNCDRLLRDLGGLGDSEAALHSAHKHAARIVQFAARTRDYPLLVETLLVDANAHRSAIKPEAPQPHLRYAMQQLERCSQILTDHCSGYDRATVTRLRLEVALWQLRLAASHAKEPDGARILYDQAQILAQDAQAHAQDSHAAALISVELQREAVGCFRLLYVTEPDINFSQRRAYSGEAEKAFRLADKELRGAFTTGSLPALGELRLLREEIELLLTLGGKDNQHKARERMMPFAELLKRYPSVYHFKLLQRWLKSEEKPMWPSGAHAIYSAPMILSFYAEPSLARISMSGIRQDPIPQRPETGGD